MTQTTANLQGQIVSSGSVILKGGKPCIIRSANNDGGYLSTYPPNDGVAVKGVFYVGLNTGEIFSTLFGSNTGFDFVLISQEEDSQDTDGNTFTVTNTSVNGVTQTITTRGEAFAATSNQFLIYREIEFDFDNNVLGLGYRQVGPGSRGMYEFQENVIFENTDDATAKENNINSRYNIY